MLQTIRTLSLILFLFAGTGALAQTPVDSAFVAQRLSAIYKVYDSMNYMSFDMQMIISADSVPGYLNSQSNSEQNAKLTVAGRKYRYELGENIFMQGDSFVIAAYKPAQTLLFDKAKPTGANSLLPGGKTSLDSLLKNFTMVYSMFSDSTTEGTKLLTFHTVNTSMPYRDIIIEYDAENNYLVNTTYVYYTPFELEDSIISPPVLQKHTLAVKYSKYRFDPRSFEKAFSEAEFIYYDGKKYWPSDAYRRYRFYNMIGQ
ncbi:MAG: hypothetical protein V4722_06935 [Bacteroidota bacterium]